MSSGGRDGLVEHGVAPDESVRTWQRRLEPVQKRVAGGCYFTRDIPGALRDAGFDVFELE